LNTTSAGQGSKHSSFFSLLFLFASLFVNHARVLSFEPQSCSPDRVFRGRSWLLWPAAPLPGRLGPQQLQQQLGLDASAFSPRLRRRRRHQSLPFAALLSSSSSFRSMRLQPARRTLRRECLPRQLSRRRSPPRRSPGSPRRPRHSPTTTPSWRRRRRRRPTSQRAASPRRATT